MNCQHYRNVMFEYFENELSPTEKNTIDRHLQTCPSCRQQYELTTQENIILMDTCDIPELDDYFNGKVMEIIKSGAVGDQVLNQHQRRTLPAFSKAIMAAVLLLACLYVPGVLPDLQDNRLSEQNALLEYSSNKSLDHDASVNGAQKQADSQLYGQQAATKNDSLQKTKDADLTGSSPMAEDNAQPQTLMMPTQKAHAPAMPMDGQSTGLIEIREASRSLEAGIRTNSLNGKPSLNNIPSGFVLIESKVITQDQTEYLFEDPLRQQSFLANISLTVPDTEMNAEEDQHGVYDKASSDNEITKLELLQNTSSKVLEYNGLTYQINVCSPVMTQQELDQIVAQINLTSTDATLQP